MTENVSWKGSRQSFVRRNKSKLRRAVRYFKNLGHKKDAGPSSHEIKDPCEDPTDAIFIKELDGRSRRPAELANNDYKISAGRSKSRIVRDEIYEMDTPPRYTERTEGKECNFELDAGHPQRTSESSPEPWASKTSLECIGSQFDVGESRVLYNQEETGLVSPISVGYEGSLYQQNTFSSPRNSIVSICTTQEPLESMQSLKEVHLAHLQGPGARNHTAPEKSLRPHTIIGFPLDTSLPTTQSQVDEIRDLVHVLNIEWIKRLDLAPNLDVEYSIYYVPSLFDTGAQALQSCYLNKLPSSFKEVFALMHLACAIVYLLHGDEPSYDWDEFFRDMLQWRHAMLKDSDAGLFVQFVSLLWAPQGSFTASFVSNCDSLDPNNAPFQATFSDLQPGIRRSTTLGASQYNGDHYWRQSLVEQSSTDIKALLKNGRIIEECSQFFHGM